MTEKEKMEAGEWYDANFDPELLKERMKADSLCFDHQRGADPFYSRKV